jgi:hypothetical protein
MAKDDRRAVVTSTSKEGTYEHIVGERLLEGGASTGPGLLGFALGEKRLVLPFGSFSHWRPLGEGVISAHVVVRLWLEVPRTHLVVCTRVSPIHSTSLRTFTAAEARLQMNSLFWAGASTCLTAALPPLW